MAERDQVTADEWPALREDANWRGGPCFELRLRVAPGRERALSDALLTDRVIVARLEEEPVNLAGEIESCNVAMRLGSLPAMGFRIIGINSTYVEVVAYARMVEYVCGCDANRDAELLPRRLLELHVSLIALATRLRQATGPLRAEIGWEGEGGWPEMVDGLAIPESVAAQMKLRTSARTPPFVGVAWADCHECGM